MKTILSQDCPLCGVDAVFYYIDYDERKYFKCSHCRKFLITRRAESRLVEAPKQWKAQLAERAQHAPMDHVLEITLAPSTTEAGRTTEALTSEYLLKSDLPL